jgi:DNA-binding MarR family transcriptional regulator
MFDKDKPPPGSEGRSPDQTDLSDQASVAFTKRDVEDAQRLFLLIAQSASAASGKASPASVFANPDGSNKKIVLQAIARRVFLNRRERLKRLNPAMFGEPAWDMLLALYFTEDAGPRQTVGRLIKMSNAPATSALRWVHYLEKEQLVVREAHPHDRRVMFLDLTPKARDLLEDYLKSLAWLGTE